MNANELLDEVELLQERAKRAVDMLARAGGYIHRIETRGREDRDALVFVLDQIHAAMVTLNPRLGVADADV